MLFDLSLSFVSYLIHFRYNQRMQLYYCLFEYLER
nr:MAG TPA: hypothetical protein [Bacteriophage sp.]